MPKQQANDLTAMAFVIPEDIFTQLSVKRFDSKEETKIIQYFKTVDEAHVWPNKLPLNT